MMKHLCVLSVAAAALLSGVCVAAVPTLPAHPVAEAQALDLAKKAISLRSVRGPGNKSPEVAQLFKEALVANGFAAGDVEINRVDDTAYLIARWPGSDPKLKPLVICGHMDVVEAKPSDWQRDPFTPVIENGVLFGRGAADMKTDDALAIAALGELRRQGFKPRRTIVIEFSGDEETAMKTSEIIAGKLRASELVLDIDGGEGRLDEAGKPMFFNIGAAENTYADYDLTVTNPGGHSSEPHRINAINQMAAALVRIGNYHFKPELTEIGRAWFLQAAKYENPQTAGAMRAFVANPTDKQAIETLTDNPGMVGKIGTTCVTTMINGGHAPNALPQRVTAKINCRIFPGHTQQEIMDELKRVANEPALSFKFVEEGSLAADPSPLRPDLVAAVESSIHQVYPGVPVFPEMGAGSSDAAYFRHVGVPSYNVSPVFAKPGEDFSHGLNERISLFNIGPAIDYYLSLIPALSR